MTTTERQSFVQNHGMITIGQIIPAKFHHDYLRKDKGQIVGWGLSQDNCTFAFVKFKNGECCTTPAIDFYKQSIHTSTQQRQEMATNLKLTADIGKKVKATHHYAFRYGDTAEIIGWAFMPNNNRPLYCIRFENNECDFITAGELFSVNGYHFI